MNEVARSASLDPGGLSDRVYLVKEIQFIFLYE
jgi:hypothetical protein